MRDVHLLSRRSFLRGFAGMALTGHLGCAGKSFLSGFLKDETLVALLSDCHVGDWNSPHYQAEKLSECITRVLQLEPLPARVLIPGDLAYHWGRKEDYALFRQLLQPILDVGIEVVLGMGNHDRRENFLEFWPEYADRTPIKGRIVSKISGVHFDYIMLDTLDQPKETDRWITSGSFDIEQREWLRAECAVAKRPLLVLGHHPASGLGLSGQGNSVASARKFGEIILGTKEVRTKCCGYIHGHDHQWYVTRSLLHWTDRRIGQTASLPSTGHWGDIGYSLLREYPDRAKLSLVQYDYFTPRPPSPEDPVDPAWQAVIRDHATASCTFVVPETD